MGKAASKRRQTLCFTRDHHTGVRRAPIISINSICPSETAYPGRCWACGRTGFCEWNIYSCALKVESRGLSVPLQHRRCLLCLGLSKNVFARSYLQCYTPNARYHTPLSYQRPGHIKEQLYHSRGGSFYYFIREQVEAKRAKRSVAFLGTDSTRMICLRRFSEDSRQSRLCSI